MLKIEVDNKREAIRYGIALGGILCLVIGVAWLYWSNQSSVSGMAAEVPKEAGKRESVTPYGELASTVDELSGDMGDQNASLVFFGTMIFSLLLLGAVAFRYYSRRDMRDAEVRWHRACANFEAQIENQKLENRLGREGEENRWAQVLKGDI